MRSDEIVASAGTACQLQLPGFAEQDRDSYALSDDDTDESKGIARRKQEERFVRARHKAQLIRARGAFCCMSGASFDVPQGFSLLQVSHFWPLGQGGPDTLVNVGLMTPNIHPVYENGLVCIRPDYSLRFAPDIPPGFMAEFRGRDRLIVLGDTRLDPAEANLAYHREEIFMRRLSRLGLSMQD